MLPAKDKPTSKSILFYTNESGMKRVVMGKYIFPRTEEMMDDPNDVGDYDEESGNTYMPEGWYEICENDDDYCYHQISAKIEGYLPLKSAHDSASERAAFEAIISQPPYERMCDRHGESSSWPGQYKNIDTQIAWEMYQAGRQAGRMEVVTQ